MLYLDNAATSWPKPEEVYREMNDFIRRFGANPSRGGHRLSLDAGRMVFEARLNLADFFNVKDSSRIVFTSNATNAINIALKGFLKPGDHVITTSMEHNSVSRPLYKLASEGVAVTYVKCSPAGELDPEGIKREIKHNTKLITMIHASNVVGTILPVKEVGEIGRSHGVKLMLDASQTVGVYPIDVAELGIDMLAFPGHKGLMGPPGIGSIYIGPEIELETIVEGGTGGSSELQKQPDVLPDRFESGTLNTLGIAGLNAGVKFISQIGLANIREHEAKLVKKLLDGLKQIKGIKLYGTEDHKKQVGVVSFNVGEIASAEIGYILDREFDVAVRSGLHCSPLAHSTIGTSKQGTVRISPGYFNKAADIDYLLECVARIAAKAQ